MNVYLHTSHFFFLSFDFFSFFHVLPGLPNKGLIVLWLGGSFAFCLYRQAMCWKMTWLQMKLSRWYSCFVEVIESIYILALTITGARFYSSSSSTYCWIYMELIVKIRRKWHLASSSFWFSSLQTWF